jgi:hypothetical protein
VRAHGEAPGLFVASRVFNDHRELVLAFNSSTENAVQQIEVEFESKVFKALSGSCAAQASAPGSYRVELPPLSYAVCEGAGR